MKLPTVIGRDAKQRFAQVNCRTCFVLFMCAYFFMICIRVTFPVCVDQRWRLLCWPSLVTFRHLATPSTVLSTTWILAARRSTSNTRTAFSSCAVQLVRNFPNIADHFQTSTGASCHFAVHAFETKEQLPSTATFACFLLFQFVYRYFKTCELLRTR